MYYVVNLKTNSILTYASGSPVIYSSHELANNHAVYAESFTNGEHTHAVIPLSNLTDHLKKSVAPWCMKQPTRYR